MATGIASTFELRERTGTTRAMQELKCNRCGADLETWNVEAEGLYGRCTHCRTSYLIDDVDRSHVVVEVRLPENGAVTGKSALSRRCVIAGGAVLVACTIATVAILPRLKPASSETSERRRTVRPLWNIGGKGPGAGQFRDYISTMTIDGQGRSAITTTSSPVVQLFDGDGRFLARWVTDAELAQLLVALPGGDLIFDGPAGFQRRNPMTGQVIEDDPVSRSSFRGGSRTAPTPDGGFLVYHPADSWGSAVPEKEKAGDYIVYFGADGSVGRTIGPLTRKVLRPDPAIPEWPTTSAMAVDGAGTIYLLLSKMEDYDTREGIYAFNPDGVFLRKIEVEQKYRGMIAAAADGALFHADPWMTRLTRIKDGRATTIDMTDLANDAVADLGMPSEIGVFPNGDLALATSAHRYLRVRWPADETSRKRDGQNAFLRQTALA